MNEIKIENFKNINILKEYNIDNYSLDCLHNKVSNYILNNIDYYYYQPLTKKYKKNIKDLLFYHQKFIFKPEYINYLQFYNLFCLSYYWSQSNYIFTNFYLHLFYICNLLEDQICKKYNYKTIYDKKILKNIAFTLFHYIIFFKLKTNNSNSIISKGLFYGSLSIFQTLMNFNYAYNKRLNNLLNSKKNVENLLDYNNNEDEFLPLNLLVFTSDLDLIKDIVNYTKLFNFSNYLFFISILLLLF